MYISHDFDAKVNVFDGHPSAVMAWEAGGWTLAPADGFSPKRWFKTRAEAHRAARDITDKGTRVFIDAEDPAGIKTGRFHLLDPRRKVFIAERRQVEVRRRPRP